MFNTVFSFEIKQQLKKPFTWIFLIVMILQGSYYMQHAAEFYGADKTYANAPAILYTVLAGMGYIGFIVTAILGGSALGKDIDNRTSALLYTTNTSERSFFYGRYLGTFVVLGLLYAGYLAGIVLYNYLPVPNLGPFSWAALLRAVLLIFLPNVFILYSFCFAVTVFAKNTKSAYGVALAGMLLMIFAETTFNNNLYVVLLDPTAYSVLHHQLEHLSPDEKNNFAPVFSGLLLYNRLIWVGLSVIILQLSSRNFSFSKFSSVSNKKSKNKIEEKGSIEVLPVAPLESLQKTEPKFSFTGYCIKVFSLSWLEFKSVVRPIGFKLFLSLLLVIYIGYIAVWQQEYYSAAPTLPVTLEITGVTLPLSFYFLLFLIINTTELLFKQNTAGFWQISDALPVPTWVTVLSKIMAMLWVVILMTFCLMIFGILVQVAKGYYHFEISVYYEELFVRWIPKYFVYILFTVFIGGLTAKRYATHWITIFFLIFSVVMHETEAIEQNRLNFMFSPGSTWSTDMNGRSIFAAAHTWFMCYWLSLSVAMLGIALWLWQRGTPSDLFNRIKSKKLHPVFIALFVAGISVFVICSNKIYQTVNVENKFQTKKEKRAEDVLYEKTYAQYRNYPQPVIKDIILNLNFFPENRKLSYDIKLIMQNQSAKAIDTLHMEWMDFSTPDSFTVNGYVANLIKKDTVLRHNIYRLNHPILPRDSVQCHITGILQYTGFTDDDPQKELTFNGSFLSNNIIPFFGFDDRRELKSNKYRVENRITKLVSRLPDTTDKTASQQLFTSTQAKRISYIFTIGTSADQTIVAPGKLEKEWQSNNRHYYRFVNDIPILFDFHILSARYSIKKQLVNINGKAVTIEVYYHPEHNRNINHVITSTKEALTYLDTTLGAYPYATLRIAERPHYEEELYAYGNVIVLPENHGWIADIRRQEDLDYLRYVTTKLIAEQYMRQANISRTLGYPVITRSIPAYLALQQLQHFYGEASLHKRLAKNYDIYLKGRAKEENAEPILLQCDEQTNYLSEYKGGYVLYHLSQIAGLKPVNEAIISFLDSAKHSVTPVNANLFYNKLQSYTGERSHPFLYSAFNSNVLIKP